MSIPIETSWSQLAGYGLAFMSAGQSLISAKRGVKQIFQTFLGSESMSDRLTQKEAQNIFSYTKDICIGSDSCSDRFSNLKSGIENLGMSAICGLVSYVVFTKGLAPAPMPPAPDPDVNLEQDMKQYETILYNAETLTQQYRSHIHFFLFGATYRESELCKEFLKPDYVPNLDEMDEALQKELYDCYKRKILFSYFERNYLNSTEVQQYIQEYIDDYNAFQKKRTLKIDSQSQSTEIAGRIRTRTKSDNQLKSSALNDYSNDILPTKYDWEKRAIYNDFNPLKERSDRSFAHFVQSKMSLHFGPFTLKLDKACEEDFFSKLPFAAQLKDKYCTDLFEAKEANSKVASYGQKLKALSPTVDDSDARSQVFEPLLEIVEQDKSDYAHVVYDLTQKQFQTWKKLREKWAPDT